IAAAARGSGGVTCWWCGWPVGGGTRRGRLVFVFDASDVGAAVAAQLRFDPVHRIAVAVGPLAAVAELSETLDRRLVLLEVEPGDEPGDGVGCRRSCAVSLGGDDGRYAEDDEQEKRSGHGVKISAPRPLADGPRAG